MSELDYSRKQLKPLIDKYAINPEKNVAFATIIKAFEGQPNYQLWGVKVVFGKAVSLQKLMELANWANGNQSLIKKLRKNGNMVCYSTKEDFRQLEKEAQGLSKISFIKNIISRFNTTQRGILTKATRISNLDGLSCHDDVEFNDWLKIFEGFSKLSADSKERIINRMSAVGNAAEIKNLLKDSLKESYGWSKEDLLAFAAFNTPKTKLAYENDHIVVLDVADYSDSKKLAIKRTQWCITTSDTQWNNYVVNRNNKQFFLFDFSKAESDELAYIGFTVSSDTGLHAAHSKSDKNLLSKIPYKNGSKVNIWDAFDMANVDYRAFLKLKNKSQFAWNMEDAIRIVKENPSHLAIAYNDNNRLVVNALSNDGYNIICGGRCLNKKNELFYIDNNNKFYVILDFNLPEDDAHSNVLILFKKDSYGIYSLEMMFNAYGRSIKEDGYLSKIDLSTELFFNREDINPSILLHKLIDENNEKEAIKLLETNSKVDVNFEFNDRRPVFAAIEQKMDKLVGKIIANKNFNSNLDDGFGESLIQTLLYSYYLDETNKIPANKVDDVKTMIETIIDSGKFDLNYIDDSEDTTINIACTDESMLWLVKKLAARKDIDVNCINDAGWSTLGNAMRFRNMAAVQIIGQRPDLVVRKEDYELAKKMGVKLDDYIKPQPFNEVTEVKVNSKEKEYVDAEVYEKIFKKVFSC